MKFLQSHYLERNTTDMCQQLSSLTQGFQESAIQFVYRTMSLRQKLILASKSPSAEIKYDKQLVQRLFLKALETGFSSETVVAEIKTLLRNSSVLDEDLIFAVGQACSSDDQRSHQKLNKIRNKPRVNMIDSEVNAEHDIEAQLSSRSGQNVSADSTSDFVSVLRSVQDQLNSLKVELNSIKQNQTNPSLKDYKPTYYDKYVCKSCKESKKVTCEHCFKCGDKGHIARRCFKSSENERELRQ